MENKETKVRIKNTFQFIQLFNGIFNLTDTEIKILATFIDVHKKIKEAGLNLNPFSTEMKKKVSEHLGRDDFNTLNNYIKSMHDKGVLKKTSDGYVIRPVLIPNREDNIVFRLQWIEEK